MEPMVAGRHPRPRRLKILLFELENSFQKEARARTGEIRSSVERVKGKGESS